MTKLKTMLIAFILIFASAAVFAQDADINVRVLPFELNDIDPNEGRMIESLVKASIGALRGVRLFDGDSGETNLYLFSGSVRRLDGGHELRIALDDPQKNRVASKTLSYRSTGEMALRLRPEVESCFSARADAARTTKLSFRNYSVVGAWEADNGLERVYLAPAGRGQGFFTSGAVMDFAWKVEGDTLVVTQTSPQHYRYYYPAAEDVAQAIAAKAEPMTWKFSLTGDGNLLAGTWSSAVFTTVVERRDTPARWRRAH